MATNATQKFPAMENETKKYPFPLNANINARLIDILNILDMRSHASVYEIDSYGRQMVLFSSQPVYKIIDKLENTKVRRYEVIALNAGLTTDILVEKGE